MARPPANLSDSKGAGGTTVRWTLADGVGLTAFLALGIAWWGAGDGSVFTTAIVATGGLACLPVTIARWRAGFGPTGQAWIPVSAVGLLVAWACMSALFSGAPWPVSVFGWYGRSDGLMLLLGVAGLFLTILTLTRVELSRLVDWLLAAGALIVVWGVLQLLGSPYPRVNVYEGLNSSLGNPNILAAVSAILGALALGRILRVDQPSWARLLMVALFGGLLSMAVFSQSTQGPVALAIAAAVMAMVALKGAPSRFQPWATVGALLILLSGLAGLIGAVLGVGPLSQVRSIDTIGFRELFWSAAWHTAQGLPLFGTGPDGLARYVGQYRSEAYVASQGSDMHVSMAHDVPLQYAATLGWIGGVAWLILVASIVALLVTRVVRTNAITWILVGACGALSAYLAQSMISGDFPSLKALGWIVMGICLALTNDRNEGVSPTSVGGGIASGVVAIVVFIIALIPATSAPAQGSMTREEALSPLLSCTARENMLQDLLAAGSVEQAAQVASGLYELDNRCPDLGPTISALLLQSGNADEAGRVANEGIQVDPFSARAWFALALVANAQGDGDLQASALAEAKRLDALDPSVDLSTNIAEMEGLAGN